MVWDGGFEAAAEKFNYEGVCAVNVQVQKVAFLSDVQAQRKPRTGGEVRRSRLQPKREGLVALFRHSRIGSCVFGAQGHPLGTGIGLSETR